MTASDRNTCGFRPCVCNQSCARCAYCHEHEETLFEHEGDSVCGACLSDALEDEHEEEHEEPEPDSNESLALTDRRGAL